MVRIDHDCRPVAQGGCGHEVYCGEFLAEWEGKMLCPECWRAAVERALRDNPIQIAMEMQLEVEQYGARTGC